MEESQNFFISYPEPDIKLSTPKRAYLVLFVFANLTSPPIFYIRVIHKVNMIFKNKKCFDKCLKRIDKVIYTCRITLKR